MTTSTKRLGKFKLNTVVTGDARQLMKEIPAHSVDMIFCDPLFTRVNDYRWLIQQAARVLKPGGNLIAESGRLYLPQILRVMHHAKMQWVDQLIEVFPLATYRISKSKVMIGYSPYLWFSKGPRKGNWVFDRFYAKGREKSQHEYGDNMGFFLMYLSYLTQPGDVVLDPFCGGGVVAAACHLLGDRDCLSFEIDPATARKARRYLARLQLPMPDMSPMQGALPLDLPEEAP